jgi:hypothetical protein
LARVWGERLFNQIMPFACTGTFREQDHSSSPGSRGSPCAKLSSFWRYLIATLVKSGEASATRISTAVASNTCQGSWTKLPSRICTWCEKGLLGARSCHRIECGSTGCNYIIVEGGDTRAARIVLNDCIKNYDRCRRGCVYYPWHPDSVLPPPPSGSPPDARDARTGV